MDRSFKTFDKFNQCTFELERQNHTVVDLNLQIQPFMQEICKPLREVGIRQFTFCRSFYNGKRLYLCSEPDWVALYLKNNFQNDIQHLVHYVPSEKMRYAFWVDFKKDKVFDALYSLGLWHGFALYDQKPTYTDLFDFCSTPKNQEIIDFYVNNLPMLEEFALNFKRQSTSLINSFNHEGMIQIENVYPSPQRCYNKNVNKAKRQQFMKHIESTMGGSIFNHR